MLTVTYKLFVLNVVMLNVIMMNVVMLSFIMLSIIMLNVVAPLFSGTISYQSKVKKLDAPFKRTKHSLFRRHNKTLSDPEKLRNCKKVSSFYLSLNRKWLQLPFQANTVAPIKPFQR